MMCRRVCSRRDTASASRDKPTERIELSSFPAGQGALHYAKSVRQIACARSVHCAITHSQQHGMARSAGRKKVKT